MPHGSLTSMGTPPPFFVLQLKFSYDKYSVDKGSTKIYWQFFFQGNYLKCDFCFHKET